MTREAHHKGRLMAMLLATVLAVGLLALAWSTVQPANAAGFKTVTKTFGRPGQVEIPADFDSSFGPASPYPSIRFIGALGFPKGAKIVDTNLKLRGFSHTNPVDVDMMLVHGGVNRTVFSDAGSFTDADSLSLTLDDQAQTKLPADVPLTSGAFKPANYPSVSEFFPSPAPTQTTSASLKGFDELNPEGQWRLFIFDDANFGFGSLENGWSLTIKARYPTS